ncbi:MAG: hypothetical protein BIFFINMI_00396 [Phycisphaerae bacterium]|nr:hypothetical protein [Phycisphaerae bacterium]
MSELHPTNQALLVALDNQAARTRHALADLPQAIYEAAPGGDCNSIRKIGEHLLKLRQFQLKLLESPLAADVPPLDEAATPARLTAALDKGEALVREAIAGHDPADWHRTPPAPREGPWGGEPTIRRLIRPLNDFTNHIGGIRAIRRILGSPAEKTQ